MAPGSVPKAKKAKRAKRQFLHKAVIEWRKARGLSQKDIADALGYDRSSISKFEHGQEPPQKFWISWKRAFKGSNPLVDFFSQNGKPA